MSRKTQWDKMTEAFRIVGATHKSSRSIKVGAIFVTEENVHHVKKYINKYYGKRFDYSLKSGEWWVETKGGTMRAKLGDVLVLDDARNVHVVKKRVFEKMFGVSEFYMPVYIETLTNG